MGGFAAGLSQGLEQARDRQIQAQQLQLQQDMAKYQMKAMESEDQMRQLNIQSLLKRVAAEQALPGMRQDVLGPGGAPLGPGQEGPQAPPEVDRAKLASFLQAAGDAGQDPNKVLELMAISDPRIAAIKESLQPPEMKVLNQGDTLVEVRRGGQRQPQQQPLGPLGTEVTGKTAEGRPIIKNPDGSVSTERTITVTHPSINGGRPTNIPSMFDGKEVSEEEAVKRIAAAGGKDPETGRNLPGFNSIQEAVEAAQGRSAELGKYGNDAEQQYQGRLERDQALEVSRQTAAGDAQVDFMALGSRGQPPSMPQGVQQQAPQPQPAMQAPQAAPPMPQQMHQGPQVRVLAQGAPKPHGDKPIVVPQGSTVINPQTGEQMFQAPAAPPKPPDFGDNLESAAAIFMANTYGIPNGNMTQLIKIDPIAAEKLRKQVKVEEPAIVAGAKQASNIAGQQKEVLTPTEANTLGVPYGTTKEQAKGIMPLTQQQREGLASFDTARVIIEDIRKYSKNVNTAPGGFWGKAEQLGKLWGAITESDTDAAMLRSKVGELTRLAKSMGEKGAMAEGDIARAAALTPGVTDTVKVAMQKLVDLADLIEQSEKNFNKSLGIKRYDPPKDAGFPKANPKDDPTTANIPVPKNLTPKQQEIFKQEYLKKRQEVQGKMQKGTTNAAKPQ